MFKLNNLNSPNGSNHSKKRLGRGIGSGLGKTSGRGHKGQKARSGGNVHPAFEGGQIPLQRRSPKVGFSSKIKNHQVKINVSELGDFAGRELSLKDLIPRSQVTDPRVRVTIFGKNAPKNFPKSLVAHKLSPGAKEILEKNSVKVEIIEHKDGARPRRRKAKKES